MISESTTRPPKHFNPTPKFGLWTEHELFERDMERQWRFEMEHGDGWCLDCGEPFHLDDVGGYNPPCACGLHGRSCHEAEIRAIDDYDDDEDYNDA